MSIRFPFFSKHHEEKLELPWKKVKKNWGLKQLFQTPLFLAVFTAFILVPFFFFFSMKQFSRLSQNERRFEEIKWRTGKLAEIFKSRNRFLKTYQSADPSFLSIAFEKLVFLKSEIETLKVIYGHPAFQSCPAVKERLLRLTKGDNRLSFFEKKRESSSVIEEVHYKQQMPVEVSGEDMKNILSLIEGVAIGSYQPPLLRPQLVIRFFDLKRDALFGRECYFLEMDLIKREPMIRG